MKSLIVLLFQRLPLIPLQTSLAATRLAGAAVPLSEERLNLAAAGTLEVTTEERFQH